VELAIGKERPMVTVEAAGLAPEQIEAPNLGVAQQVVLAADKPVKPAAAPHNRALETGDRLHDPVEGHLGGSERSGEPLGVAGHRGDRRDELLPGDVHLRGIQQYLFNLLFNRVGPAVPEEAPLEGNVANRWRVSLQRLAVMAKADGAAVSPG